MANPLKQIAFLALLAGISCGSNASEENNQLSGEDQVQEIQPVTSDLSALSDSATKSESGVVPAERPVQSAAGLNPEHGKPGHRCDISVGAPLNSAPTTTPPPVSVSPTVISPGGGKIETMTAPPPGMDPSKGTVIPTPIPTPGSVTPPPAAGKTPPGMNPPHGEPGHDCAIAVGAPLKK